LFACTAGSGGNCGDGTGPGTVPGSVVSSSAAGASAVANSGAGGTGSVIEGITGTTLAGGNGGSGICIVTEYISA